MSGEDQDQGPHGSYVQKIRRDTQEYVQELLAENERLRRLMVEVDGARRQHEERVRTLSTELDAFRQDRERLERQVADVEHDNHRFSTRFLELEQRNSDLANLYVATYRLHGTLDREEVFQAIQEIVINLVGCEEFGIYEVADGGQKLVLLSHFGLEDERFRTLAAEEGGMVRRALANGDVILAGAAGGTHAGEENLTACVPLKLGGRVVGAIVLFRLLPQKGGRLAAVDAELFDILATQAAPAVYCTNLHSRFGDAAEPTI